MTMAVLRSIVGRVSLAAVALLVTLLPLAQVARAQDVPYTDNSAVGSVGLCDRSGNLVTHGNIDDRPFVWRSVSSTAATAPFNGSGRKAVLLAYQPRKQANPNLWSGDTLTSYSDYTNPRHPMAQATPIDFSLRDFINEFTPQWDGLLQLRMYRNAPGQQPDTTVYPATDIRVSGNTWKVGRGGGGSCTDGSAKDNEILTPAQRNGTPVVGATPGGSSAAPTGSGRSTAAGAATSAPSGGSVAAGSSGASAGSARTQPSAQGSGSGSGWTTGSKVAVAVVALAAVALAAGSVVLWRRRRTA